MRARHVLYALLAVMLVSGLIEPMESNAPPSPVWWTLLSAFLMSFLPYYWYRLDSEARRFHRSRWMSTSVVALNFIGLPIYLVRSRPRGQRARALLRCFGFVALMVLAMAVGAFVQSMR
jgi:CDP-diglyceride synthetase